MAIRARKLADGTKNLRVEFLWQGECVSETSGKDIREAKRLLARRRREVREGTYKPPAERKATTIAQWARAWGEARTGRNAEGDLVILNRLIFSRAWFADLPIEEWRVKHTMQLIAELKQTPIEESARRSSKAAPGQTISPKYVANVYGLLRTMSVAARIAEVLHVDPCLIPRGTLRRKSIKHPTPYSAQEVLVLVHGSAVAPEARVFAALAFYTGMREGELCARRWSDYDPHSLPLGALRCNSQYNDRPLKTERPETGDRPRVIPVHAELAAVLEAWWRDGWQLTYGRKPTPEDRIVPSYGRGKGRAGRTPRACTLGTHTKSSAYKLWRRAIVAAQVSGKFSLHATRHTFITFTQRGGAIPGHLEKVTHNAVGTILDQYTHLGWDPVCEAVQCLRYVPQTSASRDHRWAADPAAKPAATSQVFDIIVEASGIEPESENGALTRLRT